MSSDVTRYTFHVSRLTSPFSHYLRNMFSVKNLSPKQIALFTALVLAIPESILVYIAEKSWLWAIGSLLIIFTGSYFLIYFMLERFIYRKIKLIYKFINKTKATKREETFYKYVLPQKGIDEVFMSMMSEFPEPDPQKSNKIRDIKSEIEKWMTEE